MRCRLVPVLALTLLAAACTATGAVEPGSAEPAPTTTSTASATSVPASPTTSPAPETTAPPPSTAPPTTSPSTTMTTTPVVITGRVADAAGRALAGASVHAAGIVVTTGSDGAFSLTAPGPVEVTVSKPAWLPTTTAVGPLGGSLEVRLEPRLVHALRVSRYVAMDPVLWQGHLEMAATSSVNALVFDTKDETGTVLYETTVAKAHELGAVVPIYDPAALLTEARQAGLYTITRIVTFEDKVWARSEPGARLGGIWVDMTDRANWEYPLDLAVEACRIGFDEIQFDYVRFPAGITGDRYLATSGSTQAERVATMAGFLTEAAARLHPLGCAVAAAVFGIVMSSTSDEGIGQDPTALSHVVDVLNPMVYPSHYSPGWLGFANPNSHPGPVVADALDQGAPRMTGTAILRPWLQAFYYSPAQIDAQLVEAGQRDVGWMLWNAGGNYNPAALPPE